MTLASLNRPISTSTAPMAAVYTDNTNSTVGRSDGGKAPCGVGGDDARTFSAMLNAMLERKIRPASWTWPTAKFKPLLYVNMAWCTAQLNSVILTRDGR